MQICGRVHRRWCHQATVDGRVMRRKGVGGRTRCALAHCSADGGGLSFHSVSVFSPRIARRRGAPKDAIVLWSRRKSAACMHIDRPGQLRLYAVNLPGADL